MGKRGPKPSNREISWSPEFAYAAGLMATDGCLSSDGRHFILVSKDLEQVENLKRCLGLSVSVGKHLSGFNRPGENYYRVQWGDVLLYQFFLGVGLTARKSLTIGHIHVPDSYFFDFLRGAFDGDGSFHSYFDSRWRSSFMFYINFTSASPAHITWLRDTIQRLLGVSGHVVSILKKGKNQNRVFTLRYAKREGSKVIEAMYRTPDSVHLSRKRLKIEKALRIVKELSAKH